MKTEKRQFGDFGESITCQFLMKQGFSIVEKNYLKPWGEIDVVAKKGDVIHFVEVKSVLRDNLTNVIHETDSYRPEDNIHKAKLGRLSRTIQTYCLERGIGDEWQFDIAIVYIEKGGKKAKVQLLLDVVL
jgi:putative endonuclease